MTNFLYLVVAALLIFGLVSVCAKLFAYVWKILTRPNTSGPRRSDKQTKGFSNVEEWYENEKRLHPEEYANRDKPKVRFVRTTKEQMPEDITILKKAARVWLHWMISEARISAVALRLGGSALTPMIHINAIVKDDWEEINPGLGSWIQVAAIEYVAAMVGASGFLDPTDSRAIDSDEFRLGRRLLGSYCDEYYSPETKTVAVMENEKSILDEVSSKLEQNVAKIRGIALFLREKGGADESETTKLLLELAET